MTQLKFREELPADNQNRGMEIVQEEELTQSGEYTTNVTPLSSYTYLKYDWFDVNAEGTNTPVSVSPETVHSQVTLDIKVELLGLDLIDSVRYSNTEAVTIYDMVYFLNNLQHGKGIYEDTVKHANDSIYRSTKKFPLMEDDPTKPYYNGLIQKRYDVYAYKEGIDFVTLSEELTYARMSEMMLEILYGDDPRGEQMVANLFGKDIDSTETVSPVRYMQIVYESIHQTLGMEEIAELKEDNRKRQVEGRDVRYYRNYEMAEEKLRELTYKDKYIIRVFGELYDSMLDRLQEDGVDVEYIQKNNHLPLVLMSKSDMDTIGYRSNGIFVNKGRGINTADPLRKGDTLIALHVKNGDYLYMKDYLKTLVHEYGHFLGFKYLHPEGDMNILTDNRERYEGGKKVKGDKKNTLIETEKWGDRLTEQFADAFTETYFRAENVGVATNLVPLESMKEKEEYYTLLLDTLNEKLKIEKKVRKDKGTLGNKEQ